MNASNQGIERLAEWVTTYGPALVLYAQQICDTPEDVVQEAFIRLVEQPMAPPQPAAWLYKVVRNRALSARRAQQRRQQREETAGRERPAWFVPPAEPATDIGDVMAAMEHLTPEEREILVARIWGGLSYEQLAELTDTSVGTMHRRYQAALVRLRERFDASCPKKKTQTKK